MAELIAQWRDFYGAVANASAALLGLVFVGMSLHLSSRALPAANSFLAYGTTVALGQPIVLALVMLVPIGAPTVHAIGMAVLAPATASSLVSVARAQLRRGRRPSGWFLFRYSLALVACAILAAGGIGVWIGWEPAIYAPAIFVFSMFSIGVDNAWDLLTNMRAVDAGDEVAMTNA